MTTKCENEVVSAAHVDELLRNIPVPHKLMDKGTVTHPGCLIGNLRDRTWRLTEAFEWNDRIESDLQFYAAPVCPDGFVMAYGNIHITRASKIWRPVAPYWTSVPDCWLGMSVNDHWHEKPSTTSIHYKRNPDLLYFLRSNAIICNPVRDTWQTIPLPMQHRELHVGDCIRQNDKRICDEVPDWIAVSDRLFGTKINAAIMQDARFSRPIPAKWHNWYIDPRKGRGTNKYSGSSIGRARTSVAGIEALRAQHYAATGEHLWGMVWTIDGVADHAFDMPLSLSPSQQLLLGERVEAGAHSSITWLLAFLKVHDGARSEASLRALASEALPGSYRELTTADLCQEDDLYFTVAPGDRLPLMWQPAPAKLWHQPGGRHYMFARHESAHTLLESSEVRLLHHEDRLAKIEALIHMLAEKTDAMSAFLSRMAPDSPVKSSPTAKSPRSQS